MGRSVDVEERDRLVAEAAWRVLVRDGLVGLSVRNVAAEAGLPPSSLRYTLPSQAKVRERAVALVIERLKGRLALIPEGPASRDRARAMLLELLPLDLERRTEMEAFLALGTAATTDVVLRPGYRAAHSFLRSVCTKSVAMLISDEADRQGVEAARLHALIDGLALHIIRQDANDDCAWAVEVLDLHLEQMANK